MGEPAFDLSEIIELYKGDARRMVRQMEQALTRWQDIQEGGPARQELRKLSHQLRGSGRTYGFRGITRLCKAIENIVQMLEKGRLTADERVRGSIRRKVETLTAVFD